MVWIYDENTQEAWRIGYDNILDDLKTRGDINPKETINIYNALESVLNGEDPEDILNSIEFGNVSGYPVDLILKSLKWIWDKKTVIIQHKEEECLYGMDYGKVKEKTNIMKKEQVCKE